MYTIVRVHIADGNFRRGHSDVFRIPPMRQLNEAGVSAILATIMTNQVFFITLAALRMGKQALS